MKYLLSAIIGVCTLWGISEPASAQDACGDRARILSELQAKYNEFTIFEGSVKGVKFIVTRADDGGWTILRVQGEVACFVAAGKASALDKGV